MAESTCWRPTDSPSYALRSTPSRSGAPQADNHETLARPTRPASKAQASCVRLKPRLINPPVTTGGCDRPSAAIDALRAARGSRKASRVRSRPRPRPGRGALAPKAGKIGDEDVLAEVKLRLEEHPPAGPHRG